MSMAVRSRPVVSRRWMAAQNSRSPMPTRPSSEGSVTRESRLRRNASSAGSSASGSSSGGWPPNASLSQPHNVMTAPPLGASGDLEPLLAELDDVAADELDARRGVHAVEVEQPPAQRRQARAPVDEHELAHVFDVERAAAGDDAQPAVEAARDLDGERLARDREVEDAQFAEADLALADERQRPRHAHAAEHGAVLGVAIGEREGAVVVAEDGG